MPLEATMVLLDNSEYSINSDWTPTRWEAQVDAVHVVLNRKLIDNPENTVGIMTMAGKTCVSALSCYLHAAADCRRTDPRCW